MKKLFFIMTLAFAVSLVACKDEEEPNCYSCQGSEICEGQEVDGETVTAEDIELYKLVCEGFDDIEVSLD